MPKRTGRPWQRIKARIIRRDGGICWICGQLGADTADHVTPVSLGGSDDPANLAAAHHLKPPYCNRIKGDGTVEQARVKLGMNSDRITNAGWDW